MTNQNYLNGKLSKVKQNKQLNEERCRPGLRRRSRRVHGQSIHDALRMRVETHGQRGNTPPISERRR